MTDTFLQVTGFDPLVVSAPDGTPGADGTNGVGVPTGGTTGQVLAKTSNSDYATGWANAAGGTFAGFFSPRSYGAAGGAADDSAALVACFAAAKAAGGGIVILSDQHGFKGDLVHPPRVVVQGVSAVDYVGSGTFVQAGLVALDGTARYCYGQIAQPDALGDTPGTIRDVVIDGANVGGAGAELFRAECVNGSVVNCYIIRSAGDAIALASAQNSIFRGVHVGACAGVAWHFKERVVGGQGAAGNKFYGCYTFQWTTKAIEYSVANTASFWNHDNFFHGCIFEYFKGVPFDCFAHVDSGDVVFQQCLFTFSQIAATATDDCMVHLTQVAFPTIVTTVVFDGCYFAGGVTAPPTDVILSDGNNEVVFIGRNTFRGPVNVLGIINGSTQFRHSGPFVFAGGATNVMRLGTGGSQIAAYTKQYSAVEYNITAGSALHPITIKQPADASFRMVFGETGVITFGDGTGSVLGAIAARVGGLNMTGVIQFLDGVTYQPNVVSSASGAVSLATGSNALHEVLMGAAASATITLTGNEDGRLVTVAILGNGANTIAWGNAIKWGPTGAPAAPADTKWLVVNFAYMNGEWVEVARNDRPIMDGGSWAAATLVYPGRSYLLPTGGRGVVSATRTTGATFDATERDAWTFLPGGHYEAFAGTSGNWKCPPGITALKLRLKGAGGGGGGAGASTGATLQAGAGGGAAGACFEVEVASLVAGTNYAYATPAGGTGGTGGAASGNTGVAGGHGGDATFTGPGGTVYIAKGGARGAPSAGNSTTVVAGGLHAFPINGAFGGSTAFYPGCGGFSGASCIPNGSVIGGTGGGAASATLGGVGGTGRTTPGGFLATPAGNAGTSAGANGTAATEAGCGGGGGGGGAAGTGAGGNGGAGGPAAGEVWF